MKKQLIVLIVAFLTVFSCGVLANITKTVNGKNVNVLFVQSATKAELTPNPDQAGTYKLVLHDIKKNIAYFTDRPERVSGTIPTSRFINFWQVKGPNSFNVQAPNADMNGVEMHSIFSAKNTNLSFSLSKPVYNSQNDTITYLATPLKGPQQMPDSAVKLENVKLFFDDMAFCPDCQGPP